MTHRISWTLFFGRCFWVCFWGRYFSIEARVIWYNSLLIDCLQTLQADSGFKLWHQHVHNSRDPLKHSKLIPAVHYQESLITCQEWAGHAVAKVACSCHQPATAGIFWFGVAESVTWYFRPCTNVLTVYICTCFIIHTYLEAWNIDPK